MSKEIAQTILQQLGGNRFLVMTGSNNLSHFSDEKGSGLSMRLTRNKSQANFLKITLNGNDLYDLEFVKANSRGIFKCKEINDIYCDQLQEIFTRETGLYTKL